jgi:hypothetical protein
MMGISISEFHDLIKRVKEVEQINSPKAQVGGRPTLELQDRLGITLAHLRHSFTMMSLQWLFQVPASSNQRYVVDMIDTLYIAMKEVVKLPPKESRAQSAIKFNQKDIVMVVDGAEQATTASKDKNIKAVLFSGKKKYHTFTKLLGVSPKGKVWFVSPSYFGSVNDLNLMQMPENAVYEKLTKKEYIAGDKGFRGMTKQRILTNPVGAPKRVDKSFKKIRVIVENVICELRKWRICDHTFRSTNKNKSWVPALEKHHKIWFVCCGLFNLYHGPLR